MECFGARDTFDYFEVKLLLRPIFVRTNNAFGTKRTHRRYKITDVRGQKRGKQRNAFSEGEANKVSDPPKVRIWPFCACRRWRICLKADLVLKYSDAPFRRLAAIVISYSFGEWKVRCDRIGIT